MRLTLCFLGAFLCAALSIVGTMAQEASTKRSLDQLILRAPGPNNYRLDIYKPSDDKYDGWLLQIGSAANDLTFHSEVIDDSPIAAFCLIDSCEFMVTTWGAGASSYGVRVYYAPDQQNIRRVLEQFGRGIATATLAQDGSPEITVTDFQTPISGRSFTTEEIWRWNGNAYESLGTKCVANCDNDNRLR